MKNILSEFNKILSKIKTRDYEIGSFLSNVFTIDDTQPLGRVKVSQVREALLLAAVNFSP